MPPDPRNILRIMVLQVPGGHSTEKCHRWPLEGVPRSSEVTIGHQRVFCNNFWVNRDRDSVRRLSCLSRQCGSNDMQHDLFRSGHDLDLRSNFQLDLSRSYDISFDVPWRAKNDGVRIDPLSCLDQKLFKKKTIRSKNEHFLFGDLSWPSFWPNRKNGRSTFLLVFTVLSNAAYRLSLQRSGVELDGGG